ncbi:hypothetical protein ACTFIY_002409 [Dictyostelium cf. discoideum]
MFPALATGRFEAFRSNGNSGHPKINDDNNNNNNNNNDDDNNNNKNTASLICYGRTINIDDDNNKNNDSNNKDVTGFNFSNQNTRNYTTRAPFPNLLANKSLFQNSFKPAKDFINNNNNNSNKNNNNKNIKNDDDDDNNNNSYNNINNDVNDSINCSFDNLEDEEYWEDSKSDSTSNDSQDSLNIGNSGNTPEITFSKQFKVEKDNEGFNVLMLLSIAFGNGLIDKATFKNYLMELVGSENGSNDLINRLENNISVPSIPFDFNLQCLIIKANKIIALKESKKLQSQLRSQLQSQSQSQLQSQLQP